jgi:hypothetical protein
LVEDLRDFFGAGSSSSLLEKLREAPIPRVGKRFENSVTIYSTILCIFFDFEDAKSLQLVTNPYNLLVMMYEIVLEVLSQH